MDHSAARVLVLSRLHDWIGHYDRRLRCKFRCGGSLCAHCEAGIPAEIYWVLGVEHQGRRRLLELRERHRPILEELDASPSGGVGYVLDVYKRSTALNSPVEVEIRSKQRPGEEWDISALVDALGLAPISPTSPPLGDAPQAPLPLASAGREATSDSLPPEEDPAQEARAWSRREERRSRAEAS